MDNIKVIGKKMGDLFLKLSTTGCHCGGECGCGCSDTCSMEKQKQAGTCEPEKGNSNQNNTLKTNEEIRANLCDENWFNNDNADFAIDNGFDRWMWR